MINIAIIEDERHAQEQLLNLLKEIRDVRIAAVLSSVNESISYFSTLPAIDLILSDVQLSDGLSFDIFRNTGVNIPVIFITGFDQFILHAFESNGIDYLLKPTGKEELEKAIVKYKMLEQHFRHHNPLKQLLDSTSSKKRTRMIVKKGIESISIRMEDIVMLYTESKTVYLIDKNEKKFIIDKTLNELENELDNSLFFRANRQYIINLDFVKSYKPFQKVKLMVNLDIVDKNHSIIISQLTAPYFRKWISEA